MGQSMQHILRNCAVSKDLEISKCDECMASWHVSIMNMSQMGRYGIDNPKELADHWRSPPGPPGGGAGLVFCSCYAHIIDSVVYLAHVLIFFIVAQVFQFAGILVILCCSPRQVRNRRPTTMQSPRSFKSGASVISQSLRNHDGQESDDEVEMMGWHEAGRSLEDFKISPKNQAARDSGMKGKKIASGHAQTLVLPKQAKLSGREVSPRSNTGRSRDKIGPLSNSFGADQSTSMSRMESEQSSELSTPTAAQSILQSGRSLAPSCSDKCLRGSTTRSPRRQLTVKEAREKAEARSKNACQLVGGDLANLSMERHDV